MDRDPSDREDPTAEKSARLVVLERQNRPGVLEQIEGPGAPHKFEVGHVYMVIGRSTDASICIVSPSISRRHMALRRVGADLHCEDLESRNGVFLNGIKVHSATLREGDTLQVGDAIFIYHEGA